MDRSGAFGYGFSSSEIRPTIGQFTNEDANYFVNAFFERRTFDNGVKVENHTVGLDEVKKEIRESIQSEITADQHAKLDEADKAIEGRASDTRKIKELNAELVNEKKNYSALIHRTDELESAFEKMNDEETGKNDKLIRIESIMKDGYGMWNKGEKLDTINRILLQTVKTK